MIPASPMVSEFTWLALTIRQEAEAEPYIGKEAVSFCIMNRAHKENRSISDIVFRAYQFSAWNTDSPTRMRLDTIQAEGVNWFECCKAAAAAFYELVDDPISGRTLYMNEKVVLASRSSLPEWWNIAGGMDPGIKIGAHTFRYDA